MREERTIDLVEIPIGGKDGFVWNRLHGEREQICERLLKEPSFIGRQLLQKRLRKVDEALDRVMSGSFGHCSKCRRAIDSTVLEVDLAFTFCSECRNSEVRAKSVNDFPAALVS